MIRKLAVWLVLMSSVVLAANDSRSLGPRASGEGSVGTLTRPWGTGVFRRVYIDTNELYAFPRAPDNAITLPISFGTNGGIAWQPFNLVITNATPTSGEPGTNVAYWSGVQMTNVWSQPAVATNGLHWFAIGASGGGGSGPAGMIHGYIPPGVFLPGTMWRIICGSGGRRGTGVVPGGEPYGGSGYAQNTAMAGSGGGASLVGLVGSTNFYMLAGGSGGGGYNNPTYFGGCGGGNTAGAGVGPTNCIGGYSPRQNSWGGAGYVPGTNVNAANNGAMWSAGNAYTNSFGPAVSVGGGGAGGGSAGYVSLTGSVFQASGSGGRSWADTNIFVWAESQRPPNVYSGSPLGLEYSGATAGAGVGSISSSTGNVGCVWVYY